MSPSGTPTTAFAPLSRNLILFTSGICNGCSNDFLFTNQSIDGGRKLSALSPDRRLPRFLQGGESASNCFSPLNAVVQEEQPSTEDLAVLLQAQLDEDGVQIVVEKVQEMDPDFAAASSFPCDSNVAVFTELVVVDLQVVCDFAPTLDGTTKTAIAEEFVSTYNALISGYCVRTSES
jgi:hypothetical protein